MLTEDLKNDLLDELLHIRRGDLEIEDDDTWTDEDIWNGVNGLNTMTDEGLIAEYSEAADVNDALLVACRDCLINT